MYGLSTQIPESNDTGRVVSSSSDEGLSLSSPKHSDTNLPSISLSTEGIEEDRDQTIEPFRCRSPPVISSRAGTTPPPSVYAYSTLTLTAGRKQRGQQSLVRAMYVPDEEDEIAIEERQKQQERFREAQTIQREMSQIELQYEELEEIARDVEQNLRDSEESKCYTRLFLQLCGMLKWIIQKLLSA